MHWLPLHLLSAVSHAFAQNHPLLPGIEHHYTIPKTPEQNGVSERMNRTLMETVRSMLADSKLPHRFWAEALSTANRLWAQTDDDGCRVEDECHRAAQRE